MDIENLDLIKEKLNNKISPVTCPMCRASVGFTPYAQEFQQVSYNRDGSTLGINDIQYVSTIMCRCNNCGFIACFDKDFLLK